MVNDLEGNHQMGFLEWAFIGPSCWASLKVYFCQPSLYLHFFIILSTWGGGIGWNIWVANQNALKLVYWKIFARLGPGGFPKHLPKEYESVI